MDRRDVVEVTDSTDWLGTSLACLQPVERAFRCHVCKDFYNSPMITSCNHTFCSLCIRRCLSVDGKCPLCRMGDQESKLRGNWALREAIDAFCQARATILTVAKRPEKEEADVQQKTPRRSPSPPKRKADDEIPTSTTPTSSDEHTSKRTRTSARLSKTRATEAMANMVQESGRGDERLVIDIEQLQQQQQPPKRQRRSTPDNDADYQPDDGLAACPICWMRMKPWQVDRHIDTACPGTPQPVKAVSTLPKPQDNPPPIITQAEANATSAPDRLPSLSYPLLSDTALRKKMAALGLTTTGPRQLLERRHKEWTTLWNANCDAARPKRKAALLHDLEVWERTMGGHHGGTGAKAFAWASSHHPAQPTAVNNHDIKDKAFDGAAWSSKHNTSFQDLIAQARKSRPQREVDENQEEKEKEVVEVEEVEVEEVEVEVEEIKEGKEGNDTEPIPLVVLDTNTKQSQPTASQAPDQTGLERIPIPDAE